MFRVLPVVSGIALLCLGTSYSADRATILTFQGSEACVACHDDKSPPWPHTLTDKLLDDGKVIEGVGCESCHGPGSAHVEAAGNGDEDAPKKIIRPLVNTKEAVKFCLKCHGGKDPVKGFSRSTHHGNGVECFECHSIHTQRDFAENLLKAKVPALCVRCHASVRLEFSSPHSHPLTEGGSVDCVSCHNPHRRETAREIQRRCVDCHEDKAMSGADSHDAGREEGCQACHAKHGSVFPALLKLPPPALCLQCHGALPTGHGIAGKQACETCHSDIHGSHFRKGFFE